MKKFVDPDKKHHFFKIILKEDEIRMQIPEAFHPRISRKYQSCERAVVQGPSGAYRVTKVYKSKHGSFLEKGWEVFVRENGIQIYDFLVFRYEGNMQFSVKVFNMHGVPREECFAPIRSSPLLEERITHGSSSEDETDENEAESDEAESDEEESDGNESYESDRDESYEEESDEDEEEYEVPRKSLKSNSSRKKRSKPIDVDEYVARANRIERGLASESRFPFFRITMQQSYLKHNYLPIPWSARRKYFPNDLKEVIVIASDASVEKLWRIRLLRLQNDIRLSKGVTDFIKKKNGMNLKLGDVCIFEVVEKISYKLVLRVHVFRH
ncbi:hypothetical protein MKX01_002826 [Papaver californicum]|nr:hypothetical protein MKX01_002826 [Papaver californicum]